MAKPTDTAGIAVVGAGISGLSVARMLHDRGLSVTLYESHNDIGGLVRCSIEQGALYHRVGGHVFNSKDPRVLDWFWQYFDLETEFVQAKRNAAVYLEGCYVPYPIELNLKHLAPLHVKEIVGELVHLASSKVSGNDKASQSFGEFLIDNFGETLARLYFLPYNSKIWKRDLRSIALEWLDGKLPMMRPDEILVANICGSSDSMVHSSFYYPAHGGSQFIANRLAEDLAIQHANVFSVDLSDRGYCINGESAHSYSAIVYTGDIRALSSVLSASVLEAASISKEESDCIAKLESNGTTTLLCECDANDYSWIYIPDPSLRIHRIIMTGNFSSANNPSCLSSSRTTCTIEHSGFLSQDEMESEAQMLPFNMRPISYHYCRSSYVIHGSDTADAVFGFANKLESVGIYLCGRFAQWQYFNMDAAIASAMDVVEKVRSFQGDQ